MDVTRKELQQAEVALQAAEGRIKAAEGEIGVLRGYKELISQAERETRQFTLMEDAKLARRIDDMLTSLTKAIKSSEKAGNGLSDEAAKLIVDRLDALERDTEQCTKGLSYKAEIVALAEKANTSMVEQIRSDIYSKIAAALGQTSRAR